MEKTKIRWASATLNVGIGCEKVSPGCDHCYADVLVTKRAGSKGWPDSFEEGIWKPQKLDDPARWLRTKTGAARVFVNSLSDAHWERWTTEQVDSLYDVMLDVPEHDYLVLTKRPQRMARFFLGQDATKVLGDEFDNRSIFDSDWRGEDGWLARRGLTEVPPQIWLGTTIESNRYAFRADWLRAIPATVRFLSCEPLLGPLDQLRLEGVGWVITGGESGNGTRNFRPMEPDWPAELVSRCEEMGIAHFFKQDAGVRTEMRPDLLGRLIEQYPLPHPQTYILGQRPAVGVYTDEAPSTPVTIS